MNIVIGSGPAGVSVAMALIARGQQVTLLDGGVTMSQSLMNRRQAYASKNAADWDEKDVAAWQEPQLESRSDLTMRLGSTHAQVPEDETFLDAPHFSGRSSRAVGGLSNVWGAAVLPYRQEDIEDWPIHAQDLAPHYQAVANFMPISGSANDDLQTLFPAFDASALNSIEAGPQAGELNQRMTRERERLASDGIRFGPARQAVQQGCKLCGQCLHGCPWSMIYAAQQTLEDLNRSENFNYRPGAIVERVSESEGNCHIYLPNGEELSASKLFIAAGVYETAKIILSSVTNGPSSLTMQDSRQFFLPMLHRWRSKQDPSARPLHTLAKLFVELDNVSVSRLLTHSQIYSWNEYYEREMSENYGYGIPGLSALFKAVSNRLLVAQTFIHSDQCDQVALHYDPVSRRLKPEALPNPEMRPTMDRVAKALSRGFSKTGLLPLNFAKRIEGPGASFHTGGTLPMSTSPGALQTDTLGRLSGFQNIHIVDASVLPSIPASTITFSVMANAHRIGSLV